MNKFLWTRFEIPGPQPLPLTQFMLIQTFFGKIKKKRLRVF